MYNSSYYVCDCIVCHFTLGKKRQTKNKKEKLFFGSFGPIRTYDTTFCVNLKKIKKIKKKKTSKKKTNKLHSEKH